MAIRQGNPEIEAVRERLCERFPGDTAEVARQIDLAIACADHLGVAMTPSLLENLVAEHLRAKVASRPLVRRTPPAVPLVCRDTP